MNTEDKKEQILAILEQHVWCSGEFISQQLGISRSAVAKHITSLRNLGHGIESAPRRGYRLAVRTDTVTPQVIQSLLTTEHIGQAQWLHLPHTTSSNKDAIIWAAEGAPSGSVVVAEHQSQGRGTKGKPWFSAPRAIQFSVILRPQLKKEHIPLLTALGTMAMTDAIRQTTTLKPYIKIPNDVLIQGKKVCGVLVEAGLQAEDIDWIVIGIGCNVNAQYTDFADNLHRTASSLLIEGGKPVDRSHLLAITLENMEFWYTCLCEGKEQVLIDHWQVLQKA